MTTPTILLTCDNAFYTRAINDALRFNCNIQAVNVPRNPPQLVGYKSARACARSIIKYVIEEYETEHVEWIITIEHYLDCNKKTWWSTPLILITDAGGHLLAQSPPWSSKDQFTTIVPTNFIKIAKRHCKQTQYGWSKTIGEIISRERNICADNWQTHFNETPYIELLKSAIDTTIDILEDRIILKENIKLWDNRIYDINSLFSNRKTLNVLIKLITLWLPKGTTHVAGLESNLALAVAAKKKIAYTPICLKGRLIGDVIRDNDEVCETPIDVLSEDSKVVIISDIINESFPPVSAVRLIQKCKSEITHFIVINNITEYKDEMLESFLGVPFTSLFH